MHFMFRAPRGRRARLRARTLVAALTFANAAAAFAQQTSFTLDAALQSATDRSAAMQAAQASVQASAELVVKAGQLPDPMLKAGIDNLPIDGPQRFTIGQESMTMRRIGIEQEWVPGDKRRLRAALANEVVGRERAGYLAQLANVRQQTAVAWLNATYAKKALALQRELVDAMNRELAATQAAYRGAKAMAADALQARALLAQARDQQLKARQAFDVALIDLSRRTAVPVSDVSGEPPAPVSFVPSLPSDELRHVQPTLIAADGDVAVADADVAVASSERRPNWTWEIAYQQRGAPYANMVSIGVTIPLPLNRRDRQNRDVAEKRALATKARLMYEDARRQVEADIRTQSATLASGRARLAELDRSLLPAADERVRLADAAYRAGAGSLADAFAARRARLDARLQVLDLERDVAQTWAQLEYQVVPSTTVAAQ
ncbi:TolC family protein [Burkholderia oklahomensis]|uniref:TolC family protein n=1 Tax=Burkholderia oklahomensis TaxID=342113 RepID=UPI00016A746C|nr:TolC family protein [Burkholderia oklahomensis]AJX31341.1 outer membrane efflux family protein [Burkholderia oklahomensis C6786]AOI47381.1 transporter [Burkholderia oklahomensis C6786]KUY61850.1 transporter [Burkholderia oklahomensis C6786]MBI0359903.1 TolC family protein [Burkholderia oklahomensis]SUW59288.1 Cation efflux system protein CzcC [Burkholderia oklahomensis]